ncbi:MAG: molybdopterin-dependent oxidoreductase, partial [Proteobacteria bacterium]|nr:molybdopterin-dependent oxidoreductase [Pseudomonadota bacterium]
FSGADLRGVIMVGADAHRANFTGANLDSSNLNGVRLQGAICVNASVANVDFTKTELDNVDFRGANLENSDLSGLNLARCRFDNANLDSAVFAGTILTFVALVMARGKAVYNGHPVAAVAAVDLNTALEALTLIDVVYEVLPSVLTVEQAMAPGAPLVHDDLVGNDIGERVEHTNVAEHIRYEVGDPEAGFAEASTIVELECRLSRAHQGYIEPQTATAFWSQDGKLTVWTSTQASFGQRDALAGVLMRPVSSIKVVPMEIGGGFGGKIGIYLEPLAAVLSRKCGRPVKLVMERRAVFDATGPAPGGIVRVKMGVDDKGLITAATADIRYGAGAYPGAQINPASVCVFASYRIANARVDGYDIVINLSKTSAYRAPGAPQATFATETVVDEICRRIGMDPAEFRLLNASKEGDRRVDGPAFPRIGNVEVVEAIKGSAHYRSKLGRASSPAKKRGRRASASSVSSTCTRWRQSSPMS